MFCLIFITFFSETRCQRSISPQAQKAIIFFNNRQYPQAIIEFRSLLERYPKDPFYQYYMGASLLENNENSLQACEYLKSSTFKNVDSKAWYYLGKSYFRQFKLNESLAAYNEFKKIGNHNDNSALKTSGELERVKFAQTFFSSFLPLHVVYKRSTTNDSVFEVLNNLCNCNPKINKVIKIGGYLFFSANTADNGKDIFMKIKLSDSLWTEPQNLGPVINTSEDEDYPFFDNISKTLYFASKGHNSIGGFDIFKSVYDTIENKWSEPIQLPFPINSPWDDYLWVEKGKSVYFASNRESQANNSIIYKIESPISFSNVTQLQTYDPLQICMLKEANGQPKESNPEPGKTISKSNQSLVSENNILGIISKALEIQRKSDSVLLSSRKFKLLLNNTSDKEKKGKFLLRVSAKR